MQEKHLILTSAECERISAFIDHSRLQVFSANVADEFSFLSTGLQNYTNAESLNIFSRNYMRKGHRFPSIIVLTKKEINYPRKNANNTNFNNEKLLSAFISFVLMNDCKQHSQHQFF